MIPECNCFEEAAKKMPVIDIILNALVFAVTIFLLVSFARKGRDYTPGRLRIAFRFFTCQSNVLCAVVCFLAALFGINGPLPEWVWLLKYIGTVAVTVTMLTVFLFLAPSVGKGWMKRLLGIPHDFIMHLVSPVAALVSLLVFERRSMTFFQAMTGMLPVILYGILYIRKTQFGPKENRWDDFYGFNRSGKLWLSVICMLFGTFLICLLLMALQR